MSRTIIGKISFAMLLVFLLQVLSVNFMLFIDGLLTITLVLYSTFITAPLFLIIGLIGVIKEESSKKKIPLFLLMLGVLEVALFLFIIFEFSFGE